MFVAAGRFDNGSLPAHNNRHQGARLHFVPAKRWNMAGESAGRLALWIGEVETEIQKIKCSLKAPRVYDEASIVVYDPAGAGVVDRAHSYPTSR